MAISLPKLELQILGVSVGQPAPLGRWQDQDIISGIRKMPVRLREIRLRRLNLDGDGQADLRVHGGVDKAVYAYPAAHADWWTARGLHYRAGFMGENLTLDGADEAGIRIGDQFAWGGAILEVSEPRGPCYKLGLLTGREDAPGLMTLSGHCGWYFRVLREAVVPVDDVLIRTRTDGMAPAVRDAFFARTHNNVPRERVREIAAYPALAQAWRASLERTLTQRGG